MRIHEDLNGVRVNAISRLADDTDVNGTLYQVMFDAAPAIEIKFHSGSIEKGLAGLTTESLLAILAHRLDAVNQVCPCQENEAALYHVKQAHEFMDARIRERVARGIAGTQET